MRSKPWVEFKQKWIRRWLESHLECFDSIYTAFVFYFYFLGFQN